MNAIALLALERHGRLVPLCRTKSREVVKAVAQAALAEVRAAAEGEEYGDEVLSALLKQEADRIGKALVLLGLASCPGLDPEGGDAE